MVVVAVFGVLLFALLAVAVTLLVLLSLLVLLALLLLLVVIEAFRPFLLRRSALCCVGALAGPPPDGARLVLLSSSLDVAGAVS